VSLKTTKSGNSDHLYNNHYRQPNQHDYRDSQPYCRDDDRDRWDDDHNNRRDDHLDNHRDDPATIAAMTDVTTATVERSQHPPTT
jgi:hypothetical protein